MENKIIVNYMSSLRKTLSWLRANSNNLQGVALRDYDQLLSHLEKVFLTRGVDGGIAYIKLVRMVVLNFLSGNSIRPKGVSLSNRGLPSCLGPELRSKVISECPKYLRLLMTVLFSSRALKGKPLPDIDTIIGPLKQGSTKDNINLYGGDFWRELGYFHKGSLPRSLKFNRFHFSTKSGPNGHALNSWLSDLVSLPKQLRDSIGVLGGEKISNFMRFALENVSWVSEFFPCKLGKYRKITYFADKEGKTRVIAIGDYFSQTVLKGLHKYLYRVLKKIPQDMTFDQGAFRERVKDWPVYYSVDLSAATDRFPISIISSLLSSYLPKPYVRAWEDIMVGYPFSMTDKNKKELSLSYAVGNPMGFYSSWASFALAHHYIMYYLSRTLKKDWKTLPYCLLGDDIVIGDKDVGEAYLQLIKSLGVEVSMAKTHRSTTTLEFAKRWIHRGQEITPFPLSALKHSGDRYYLLTALLCAEEKKGWSFGDVSNTVGEFYGVFYNRPSRFKKSIVPKAHICEQIMKVIWGVQPAGESITRIARRLGYTFTINDLVGTNILANIAVECFANSNPANQTDKKSGKPLGLLAESCLIWLTGKFEELPEATTLLENPLLHSYGSVEESYLSLLKLARKIDTVEGGKWPVLLRAMAIPLSDKLFIDRHEATTALGVSMIGKHIKTRLEMISQYPGLLDF